MINKFMPYIAGTGAILLVIATWQVQEWRHDAIQKDAIVDAVDEYKNKLKASKQQALELESQLAAIRQTKAIKTKKVNDYVKSQPIDPVCFDKFAVGLFNSNRR